MKIVTKIAHILVGVVCIGIILAMILTLATQADPQEIRGLLWTDEAIKQYQAYPDSFVVYSFKGFDDRSYSSDYLFGISRVTQLADINQWQCLIRYNDSSITEISEKYGESGFEVTEKFIFVLEDDLGHTFYDYDFITARGSRHSYIRLVWSDVPMSYKYDITDENGVTKTRVDRVTSLTLKIYLREKTENGVYPASPLSEILMYGDGPVKYDYKSTENDYKNYSSVKLRNVSELLGE